MNLGFYTTQIIREFNLIFAKDFDILRVVNRLFPLAFFECGIHCSTIKEIPFHLRRDLKLTVEGTASNTLTTIQTQLSIEV